MFLSHSPAVLTISNSALRSAACASILPRFFANARAARTTEDDGTGPLCRGFKIITEDAVWRSLNTFMALSRAFHLGFFPQPRSRLDLPWSRRSRSRKQTRFASSSGSSHLLTTEPRRTPRNRLPTTTMLRTRSARREQSVQGQSVSPAHIL